MRGQNKDVVRATEISDILKQQIAGFDQQMSITNVGRVVEVGDGIAQVYGLSNVMASELVEFTKTGVLGMAFNLEEDSVGIIIMGEYTEIEEGDEVRSTGRIASVPVGDAMIGRVVNALGQPIDGKGPISTDKARPIERIAPGVVLRQDVDQPLQTGIKSIDSMIPIGRGQRELIIGDRQTGKTRDRARHHHQSEGSGRHLHLRRHWPEAGPGRAGSAHFSSSHGAMEHTIVVERLRFRPRSPSSTSLRSPVARWAKSSWRMAGRP